MNGRAQIQEPSHSELGEVIVENLAAVVSKGWWPQPSWGDWVVWRPWRWNREADLVANEVLDGQRVPADTVWDPGLVPPID